tara:strand:- start:859 stop:1275 length:417 start_codon:yes stop_codon:yes gene_type:complete
MIREAVLDDLELICKLAIENHATVGLELPPINVPKFLSWIKQANKIYVGDKADGVLALRVVPFDYADALYVTNLLFYVKPQSRKSLLGVRLLGAAKKYAHDLKLPLIMGVMTGEDAELKGEFFKRQHMRFIGGAYMEN